jgi:hypothetical protein
MVRDLTCSAALLIIAASYYALASGIGRSALADEVGPAGLPVLYAAVLAVLALALAAKALLRPSLFPAPDATGAKPALPFILRRAAGVAAIGIGYLLIVPLAGYFLTLAMTIAATALYFGERISARLAVIAITGAATFWALFVWLLGIPMPALWGT